MYVSLHFSSARGMGVPHNRGMPNTWQSIMVSLNTNYCLSVFNSYHLHLLPCAVEDFELIGLPEYKVRITHLTRVHIYMYPLIICAPFFYTHATEED